MTNRLILESSHGGGKLEFEGEIPRGLTAYDGTSFRVSYTSSEVSAAVEVFDIQPQRWSGFFQQLADNWTGWAGVKEHGSLEHHLKLSCTADSTGHIELRCTLRSDPQGPRWQLEASLLLEGGQLDGLARRARAYFGT